MQWTDEGIIIGTRRHGETSLIVELMTPGHGRHLGLVRGGRSRRIQGAAAGQFGHRDLARAAGRASWGLHDRGDPPAGGAAHRGAGRPLWHSALAGLLRLLPERDPHPRLYTGLQAILDWLDDPLVAADVIVRFELKILDELGFGLDLEQCAATGTNDDLAYVSPRTGRAVTRSAGEPYARGCCRCRPFSFGSPPKAIPALRKLPRLSAHRLFPRPPRLRAARAGAAGRAGEPLGAGARTGADGGRVTKRKPLPGDFEHDLEALFAARQPAIVRLARAVMAVGGANTSRTAQDGAVRMAGRSLPPRRRWVCLRRVCPQRIASRCYSSTVAQLSRPGRRSGGRRQAGTLHSVLVRVAARRPRR